MESLQTLPQVTLDHLRVSVRENSEGRRLLDVYRGGEHWRTLTIPDARELTQDRTVCEKMRGVLSGVVRELTS